MGLYLKGTASLEVTNDLIKVIAETWDEGEISLGQ
jgi:hypothetical protein